MCMNELMMEYNLKLVLVLVDLMMLLLMIIGEWLQCGEIAIVVGVL